MSYDSLDSVSDALNEYEEYLGDLVARLQKITGKLEKVDDAEDWSKKIRKVEERLFAIERQISDFLGHISQERKLFYSYSKPLIVRFKNWEEFKNFSSNAELISFLKEEDKKSIQVTALKDGKVVAYCGQFPDYAKLLKTWISTELNTENRKVVEGVLAWE
jgi:hypothetical protein